MGRYSTTIKAREKQANEYADLIREAFEFDSTIFVYADVEGQPNPDSDHWSVRAEVQPDTHILFKLGPHSTRGQAILATIVRVTKPKGGWEKQGQTVLRETIMDMDEARIWISRAWAELNPNDPSLIGV